MDSSHQAPKPWIAVIKPQNHGYLSLNLKTVDSVQHCAKSHVASSVIQNVLYDVYKNVGCIFMMFFNHFNSMF